MALLTDEIWLRVTDEGPAQGRPRPNLRPSSKFSLQNSFALHILQPELTEERGL